MPTPTDDEELAREGVLTPPVVARTIERFKELDQRTPRGLREVLPWRLCAVNPRDWGYNWWEAG